MKILILTFYYEPDLCAGSFRASAFVKSIKKKLPPNTSVDIITTMPNRYGSFFKDAKAVEQEDNIHITRVRLPKHKSGFGDQAKAFGFYFFATLKLINFRKYDVVYATSSRLFTAFLGAVAARKNRAWLYLDIRDIFTDTMKSLLSPKKWLFLAPVFYLIEKFTIRSAHQVNLVSQGFENYFKKISPRQNFSYFTNGIDEDFLGVSYQKEESTEKKVITYAGNMGQGQGLEHIIPELADRLGDDFEFWLVGDGGMRSVLAEKIQEKKLKNVKIIDPVDRAELISIYRKSDYLFLHLNDYPAFEKVLPSKIFEYAVTGKPILAGVKGYSREFLQKNLPDVMVFDPCSPENFFSQFQEVTPSFRTRTLFVHSFSRNTIMDQMTDQFLIFCEKGITRQR